MKFAHEFKTVLIQEGFPSHWVDSAIPYGQLKKCIKRVASELRAIGLDSATLAQLIPDTSEELDGVEGSGVAFRYDFDDAGEFRPKLTLFIRVEDGIAVDAALAPDTRKYLERLAARQTAGPLTRPATLNRNPSDSEIESGSLGELDISPPVDSTSVQLPVVQRVEIPLTFDAEFFGVLQTDVTTLDSLQDIEKKSLGVQIIALSSEIAAITKPSKYGKSDLYRWRELFEIYLEASPFFSTREADSGSRSSKVAARQLQWFQSEVTKRNIVRSFKLPASRQALNRFIAINITLLQNLSFQSINQKAVTKILKKFDKRTRLGATRTFPRLFQTDSIMTETMAKAVCAQMSTDIVKIVPQVDDYLCPICFTISWRPIRMKCKHIFCIRCTVLMQREKKQFCPLCRDDVIMEADADNIDGELVVFMKKYFPKETREKQIAIETADGIEQFGINYKHPSEYKCTMM